MTIDQEFIARLERFTSGLDLYAIDNLMAESKGSKNALEPLQELCLCPRRGLEIFLFDQKSDEVRQLGTMFLKPKDIDIGGRASMRETPKMTYIVRKRLFEDICSYRNRNVSCFDAKIFDAWADDAHKFILKEYEELNIKFSQPIVVHRTQSYMDAIVVGLVLMLFVPALLLAPPASYERLKMTWPTCSMSVLGGLTLIFAGWPRDRVEIIPKDTSGLTPPKALNEYLTIKEVMGTGHDKKKENAPSHP